MSEQNIQKLREILVREFNEDELTALCHDIGLNYADLQGMGPYGKTREIMTAVQEQRLVRTLMYRVQQLRPTAYKEAGLETVEPDRPLTTQPLSTPPQSTAVARPAPAVTQGTPKNPNSADSGTVPVNATVSPSLSTSTDQNDPSKSKPEKETSNTMDNGPRKSALPLRIRLIGFIIVVLLLAVAVLSIVLQPRKGGTPVAVPPTTAVTLAPPTSALTNTVQLSQTVAPAATPQAIVPEVTPTPAGTISETHPAAAAMRSINETQLAYYTGKAKLDELKSDYAPAVYKIITDFAFKTLKTKLGADLAKGDTLNVTLRYDKVPTLTSDKGGVATVMTKEYWVYTNPANSKTYCDNSEYTYTMSKVGDVYQVKTVKSKPISSKCEQ